MKDTYTFHEAANIFPLDDENIDTLAEDIREQGLEVPIELCGGQIIDGRRRSLACEKAGVEPEFVEVSPEDPIAYVLSLNIHRRHLSTTQRGMVAARAREMYDKAAKERQKEGGKHGRDKQLGGEVENLPHPQKARDAAGKAVGVSGKSVDYASRVLKNGCPELIKAVDSNEMAVSTAARMAPKPHDEQRAILAAYTGGKPGARVAESAEAPEPPPGESRGVGVRRGNEAIDALKRIPRNDALRKRGFQLVTDWIRNNK
jgi:ParB-like chromosome segregation protein Spo0J